LFLELLEILPWHIKPSIEKLLGYYTLEYVKSAILMDDAIEVLVYLKTNYKIGMITNGKVIIQYGKIDKLKLRGYFDTIVVSEEAGFKKPNKAIFEIALKNLNLSSEECIYIGDHPVNDIDGADKAGMKTIWIKVNQPWKHDLTVKPLKTINRLNELLTAEL
jgi:putative hydrolase of the HAD superfamily